MAGGGARGAYEVGVLRFLIERLPKQLGHPIGFQVLAGTSVGAIHACFLAATAEAGPERAEKLAEIWEGLHVDEVFRFTTSDLIGLPRRLLGLRKVAAQLSAGRRPDRLHGLLDTRPLEKLVIDKIPWKGIRQNLSRGLLEGVCVTATQIATGRAVVFVERATR